MQRAFGPYQLLGRSAADDFSESFAAIGPLLPSDIPRRPSGAPYRDPLAERCPATPTTMQPDDRLPCTLRCLRSEHPAYARLASALRKTAELGRVLRHPRLLAVSHADEIAGCTFLVVARLASWQLDGLLQRMRRAKRALAQPLALHIVRCLALGLERGHRREKPIVHGAIHPGHALVTADGAVLLTDYAETALRAALPAPSLESLRGGYLSPEQLECEPLDARSDVCSLGMLLYELICAQPRFTRRSALSTLEALAGEQILPPSRAVPGLSRTLEATMLRALERERQRRFLNAPSLAARLEVELERQGLDPSPNATWGSAALAALGSELYADARDPGCPSGSR